MSVLSSYSENAKCWSGEQRAAALLAELEGPNARFHEFSKCKSVDPNIREAGASLLVHCRINQLEFWTLPEARGRPACMGEEENGRGEENGTGVSRGGQPRKVPGFPRAAMDELHRLLQERAEDPQLPDAHPVRTGAGPSRTLGDVEVLRNAAQPAQASLDHRDLLEQPSQGRGGPKCTPKVAVQKRWNIKLRSCNSPPAFEALLLEHGEDFDSVNISTAFHIAAVKFARHFRSHIRLQSLRLLMLSLRDRLLKDQVGLQGLTNSLWAIVKIWGASRAAPRFMEGEEVVSLDALISLLVERSVQKVDSFEPQNISNTLWSVAKWMGRPTSSSNPSRPALLSLLGELLQGVTRSISVTVRGFSAQNSANTFWVLAKIASYASEDMIPRRLVLAVVARTREMLLNQGEGGVESEQLLPQHLANILWAYASLGFEDSEFLSLWDRAAEPQVARFNSQDAWMCIYGLAKTRRAPFSSTWTGLMQLPPSFLEELSPEHVGLTVWAVAEGIRLGVDPSPGFLSLLRAAVGQIKGLLRFPRLKEEQRLRLLESRRTILGAFPHDM